MIQGLPCYIFFDFYEYWQLGHISPYGYTITDYVAAWQYNVAFTTPKWKWNATLYKRISLSDLVFRKMCISISWLRLLVVTLSLINVSRCCKSLNDVTLESELKTTETGDKTGADQNEPSATGSCEQGACESNSDEGHKYTREVSIFICFLSSPYLIFLILDIWKKMFFFFFEGSAFSP